MPLPRLSCFVLSLPCFLALVALAPLRRTAGAQTPAHGVVATALGSLDASSCGSAGAPPWCAGADLGGWVNAADRALGAAAGVIAITRPGKAATPIRLSPGHSLQIGAPITLQASAKLEGSQTVSCSGPLATITSPNGPAFEGATGAAQVTLRDCTFPRRDGLMLYIPTYMTDLAILNNTGGCILFQGNKGTLPGTNYLIEGNTAVNCPAPAAVYITQAWDNIRVLGNHFLGGVSGAEWFAIDAGHYPSYAAITGGINKNAVFANNTCEGQVGTCAWGSGMWRTLMQGNSADGCGDICFDLEGSADSSIVGNTCRNAQNGCACPAFFTGFHNSVLSNDFVQATGNPLILLKNNQGNAANIQDIVVSGNSLTCAEHLCAAVHNETSVGMTFSGNRVLNGRFDNVGVMLQGVIQDNVFSYTVQAFPGAGNTVNAGLNTPTQYHSYVTVKNNVIDTRVAQAPGTWCLNAAQMDPTGGDTFYIEGNECTGPWPGGIYLSGAAATYHIHNNFLPVLPVVTGSALFHSGNSTPAGTHD